MISVKRNLDFRKRKDLGYYPEYRPGKITEIKDNIFYVDMERSFMKEINAVINNLSNAKGVIFDMRGYPIDAHRVLFHLTGQKVNFAQLMIPLITYPDMENLTGYDSSAESENVPLKPRFNGKIVFLTNGRAISYSETIMSAVESYKLGTIIGEPSAGTNGNINEVKLNGNYIFKFTGMRVLKHNGSQLHGIGIIPDILVNRTIQGIREKRDEYLEKAIEVIESVS